MKFQKRFLLNDGNSLPTRRLMTAFYQHELPNCPKDYNTHVGIVGISTSSNVLRNCYTRQQQQLPKYLIRSYPHYDTNGIEVNDTSRHFTTTTTTTIRKQQQQRCNKTFVTTPTLHVESTFRYPYSSKASDDNDNNKIKETVSITYVEMDGTEKTVQAEIGKNLMEIAHEHNVDLEGACGGELACSTCHLVFEQHIYDTLPEKLDDEIDMLDLAVALTETSRLGCQIKCRKDFDGMKVRIPDDGF